MTELLLGCGHMRVKIIPGNSEFTDLYTLDINPNVNADLTCDLNRYSWRARACNTRALNCLDETSRDPHPMSAFDQDALLIKDNFFDEVHAYEVLEHLGQQGHAYSFFATFKEIYRILKPMGSLYAKCPGRTSPWLWGDPSHTRVIQQESLMFLDQRVIWENRHRQAPMSDFSHLWKEDFRVVVSEDNSHAHIFQLMAMKPVRTFTEK